MNETLLKLGVTAIQARRRPGKGWSVVLVTNGSQNLRGFGARFEDAMEEALSSAKRKGGA